MNIKECVVWNGNWFLHKIKRTAVILFTIRSVQNPYKPLGSHLCVALSCLQVRTILFYALAFSNMKIFYLFMDILLFAFENFSNGLNSLKSRCKSLSNIFTYSFTIVMLLWPNNFFSLKMSPSIQYPILGKCMTE